MANYGIKWLRRIGRNVLRAMSQTTSPKFVRSTISLTHTLWRIFSSGIPSMDDSTVTSAMTNRTLSHAATKFAFLKNAIRQFALERCRRGRGSGVDRIFHQSRQSRAPH